METLAKLRPAFTPKGGTVTAGNSSQMSRRRRHGGVHVQGKGKAELGLKPLLTYRSYLPWPGWTRATWASARWQAIPKGPEAGRQGSHRTT
jgi:hypothetical protein